MTDPYLGRVTGCLDEDGVTHWTWAHPAHHRTWCGRSRHALVPGGQPVTIMLDVAEPATCLECLECECLLETHAEHFVPAAREAEDRWDRERRSPLPGTGFTE